MKQLITTIENRVHTSFITVVAAVSATNVDGPRLIECCGTSFLVDLDYYDVKVLYHRMQRNPNFAFLIHSGIKFIKGR